MGSLQHPAHDHALNLRLLSEDFTECCALKWRFFCRLCSNVIQAGSTSYCCEECSEFLLHRSCAELPSDIQHPFHQQHPLKMFVDPQKYANPKKCDVCKGSSLVYFDCSDCGNRFCSSCIVNNMPDEDSHTRPADDLTAHHFTHHHSLKSFNVGMSSEIKCKVCMNYIEKGEAYGCFDCAHFLHKNCAGFSQELRHPFHPQHPLTLLFNPSKGSKCNACRDNCYGPVYLCGQCQFNLHLDCAISTMEFEVLEDRGLFIDHFSHQHRLKSFLLKMKSQIRCDACGEKLSGETYICADCMFFVHKSCTQAPSKVKLPPHEEHSLVLVPKSAYGSASLRCSSCNERISSYAFAFSCQEACEFALDVECALETLSYLSQGGLAKIESRWHDHPLQLCYWKYRGLGSVRCKVSSGNFQHTASCKVCDEPVEGLAYKCGLKECIFLLHRSCADFPLEMQHPSHPQHTLTFHSQERGYRCTACFTERLRSTSFFCAECDFKLDLPCASRNLTFKHPLHEHGLCYFEEIQAHSQSASQRVSPRASQKSLPPPFEKYLPCAPEIEMYLRRANQPPRPLASPCKACGRSCRFDLYRCVPCNFNIHRDCLQQLRLPHKIKHGKHFHQLTLEDSFVEDDYGVYICDFCAKDRNPKLGVYYCKECSLESTVTAHMECALSADPVLAEKVREIQLEVTTANPDEVARLDARIASAEALMEALSKDLDGLKRQRAQFG